MIAVAIVVVLAAIIAVVVATSGNDDSNAGGSGLPSSSVASTSASTSSSPPSTSSSPTGSWSTPYQQFTDLIGATPGAAGYKGATCSLAAPDSNTTGMIDQVSCRGLSNGSKVVFYVGRFSGKAAVDSYISELVKLKYKKQYWTIESQRRGLLLTSPSTIKYADVTSSICALPEFLVQFYAAEGSGIDEAALENDYWKDSSFPDDTPAVCT